MPWALAPLTSLILRIVSENPAYAPTDHLNEISLAKDTIVAAVITFGDPTHVAGKPYNAGSSTKNGVSDDLYLGLSDYILINDTSLQVSPRSNTAALDTYGPIMQSYCDTGDKFCDSGSSLQVHLDEIKNHGPAAASFIVSKFKGSASAGTSGGNETATPTTGTSSPSITCQALVLQTTSLL